MGEDELARDPHEHDRRQQHEVAPTHDDDGDAASPPLGAQPRSTAEALKWPVKATRHVATLEASWSASGATALGRLRMRALGGRYRSPTRCPWRCTAASASGRTRKQALS